MSVSGKISAAGGGLVRPAGRRPEGFTLIEIMVVVMILLVLATLIVFATDAILGGSKKRATQALIERLKLHIEEYRTITGRFPPDGIDSRVENENKVALKSSAALYHALTTPIDERQMVGGIPKLVRHEPITQFDGDLRSEVSADFPGVREIRDAFGNPLHYDNTLDGFSPQGGGVHYPPLSDSVHPPDPRTLEKDAGGVARPGPQSSAYDLWSHGLRGHNPESSREPPIATWNLQQ